jgi:hypothetical protein
MGGDWARAGWLGARTISPVVRSTLGQGKKGLFLAPSSFVCSPLRIIAVAVAVAVAVRALSFAVPLPVLVAERLSALLASLSRMLR